QTLATLFGGSPFFWSVIFFLIAAGFVCIGLRTIKIVELLLILSIFGVMVLITLWSVPQISLSHLQYVHWSEWLFPYGVLLFAFHSARAVPEAYSILRNRQANFKQAILWAGALVTLLYVLFAAVVVGVTGRGTTEIATIGLGKVLGNGVFILGNVFAALAMSTSFLMSGVALRDSLAWDFRIHSVLAAVLVCGVPFVLFLLGVRQFIETIDLLGSVFITFEVLLVGLIWIKAKKSQQIH
ncbi:MAG: aromatic amino acid transport family protein, partial [Patescibacteria group bacterium]